VQQALQSPQGTSVSASFRKAARIESSQTPKTPAEMSLGRLSRSTVMA
jgi:hypothetical protein